MTSPQPANAELIVGEMPSKKAKLSDAHVDAQRLFDMHADSSSGGNVFPKGDNGELPIGHQMVFIELCAGSAVLSATAQKHGYRVMPVDCKRNRHKPRCKVVSLDLAEDHACDVLKYIVETCQVAAVHFAPPCGTCSKARGIPMPDGSPGPQPVRSNEFLMGIPGIPEMDQIKVDAANRLYLRMGLFIQWLHERGVAWVVENPTNSFLWELPYFSFAVEHGVFAHCHACAFGGTRPKKTSFLSNKQNIAMMQLQCEDVAPHEHEPWGYTPTQGFATALEAQYPDGMCSQLVRFLDEVCLEMGVTVQPADYKPPRANKQPRGRSTPQLIPEYEKVVSVLLPDQPCLDTKRCLVSCCKDVPAGSRLLRTEKKGSYLLCVFGIFHSCERFVKLSQQLWHPFDLAAHMPDHLLRCLFEHATQSPMEIVKLRIRRLKLWTRWASELAVSEKVLRAKCDPVVRDVLGPKRLLLMEKIADSIGWPDVELFKEMRDGFRLVGNATKSNVFQSGIKAATMSEQQLMKDAKFLKPALLGKIRASGCDDNSQELYDTTLAEAVDKNWLSGPFSPRDVDGRFETWLPVRRFAVKQKGKLRPIDDLKENRVNDAFSSTERASLYAMDHLVWLAIFLSRFYRHGGEVSFELADGTVLHGYVHKDWLSASADLRVTAMDLKSAYKQLPLSPLDSDKAVISLWSQMHQDVKCFVCHTLPFGASASVHNFLRVSSFLQAAGCSLGIMWTSYFDDFPMISHALHTSSTLACAKGLMGLLGFVYSEEKLADFDYTAEILGVVLDLREASKGRIAISNKPSRIGELRDALDEILSVGQVIPNKLPSVLGKLQYADSHVWGRSGRLALADLREIGHTSPMTVRLDATQMGAFRVLRERLCSGRPKVFRADVVERPTILFTDGALEYNHDGSPHGTVGAVAFLPDGIIEVFGAEVPSEVLDMWQSGGKTHVIGLIELYACVVALVHWRNLFSTRRVILFVDNWPALDVMVKGTSLQDDWRRLLLLLEDPCHDDAMLWVARVPSSSNVADHPSRGDLRALSFLGPYKCVAPLCPFSCTPLKSIVAEADGGDTHVHDVSDMQS